ncbi:MAG: GNAT family N-acetyltransferase [Chloroflexi bacterium]|nr:GNAT family N-acetyltransferase [Chloroflexota bacterium]
MNVEIRLVTRADFEQVGHIFAEENRFHAELVPEIIQIADPIMTQEWFDDVLNNPSKTLFVAEMGTGVVGVALVDLKTSIDDPIFRQRRYIHISEIAVAASHRGQGIGRLLMERIHQWGQAQGIAEIELQVWERNDQAIGFYKNLGYQMWRRTMRFTLDEEVRFSVANKDLNGILTRPASDAPYPAIVLLHGSDRSGVEAPFYKQHAEKLVQSGFAVLRYDGPGWGGSSSEGPGFETLEYRTEEAITAVKYLQSRPDIKANNVGLWGISQGGWICQMAAAAYDGVAFIIPVSGPGVTPAEQEVYRVEAESKAAGFDEDEVAKAVLMRRLMADIVLVESVYQIANQSEAKRLGAGPWDEVVGLVYGRSPIDPIIEYRKVIKLLNTIKDKPWTKFLYLEQVLPMFEGLPPEAWEMAKGQMRAVMNVNPADFLTKVRCPVLAIFGEKDRSVPVEKSIALYKKYLQEAGNKDVTIELFPDADHVIQVNDDFAPGYFEIINNWLKMKRG